MREARVMGESKLKVTDMSIKLIKPYGRNPRLNDAAVDAVVQSITAFGWRQPIVVDGDGVIIVGHTRWKAAQKMGLTSVPVHVAEGLTPEQVKAYRLADNRSGEFAEWDFSLLAEEIDGIGAGLQAQLDALDFDGLLEEAPPALPEEGLTDADAVPEPPKKPFARAGDLWLCGEHRVLCGDSTKPADVARLMGGEKADAVVTDPPYGIGFQYDSYDDDRKKWFELMDRAVPIMRAAAPFVVMPCCGIDRLDWWYKNHKPDWLMCWYKGSPGHRSHVGFNDWEAHVVWGKPPKQMHDYWQTACGFEVAGHPCPKPAAYAAWLVERAAATGAIVFDPFLGSGTTMIAAEQLGRRCFGIEIAPVYCDVILRRYAEFTGDTPTREDGTPFPQAQGKEGVS